MLNTMKLRDLLKEESPCWKGYQQIGMKDKGGKQVPNCVPIDENSNQAIECEECGWEWDLADGGKTPYVCHKCGHDNTEDYDELDVEDDDKQDFIKYLKGYINTLKEANCNCVFEAEYQGRDVKLGKPMQGDVKKFKVYVKNPKTGKVIKVNFGQKGMVIKKNNPERRKSFRARMNCDNPGPRTKANYWSCRKW